MKFVRFMIFSALALALAGSGYATIFGNVRGIVHDPQHRPIPNAQIVLSAAGSGWSKAAHTNANGEFEFTAVPAGDYITGRKRQGISARGSSPSR